MPVTIIAHAALYDRSLGGGASRSNKYCEMVMYTFARDAPRLGSMTSRKFEFLIEEIEGAMILDDHKQHRKMNSACKSVIVVSASFGPEGLQRQLT